MFEHFPYTNMHELNLDWIIEQVKKAYSPDNPPDNLVLSVNGQTGEVVLYKDANVQLPSVESNQWNIYRLVSSPNGQTARGIEFSGNGTARIINGTHRALIYTSENPPDYPVDSVNGQTGAVKIQVPFVNTTDELMQFATDSEDNYWGLRRNTTGGEAGIYLDTAGETVRAYITLMPEYEGEGTPQTFQLLTTNDIPESSGVVSVNGMTGVVRLFGTNIYRTDNSNQTLNQAISTLENSTNSLNTRTRALEDGIAIVANGNTHPAIASGQFVYVKNHESLTEGLYTANSAIGTNASLTTSNLTADGSGGLNALKAKIGNVGNTDLQEQVTSLNSKITNVLNSGQNLIGNIILPGYNTGSGNYFDFFVPCNTGGKTVTSASLENTTIIHLATTLINFSSAPEVTVMGQTAYGVRLEVRYSSPNTPNVCGTIYAIELKLTCS